MFPARAARGGVCRTRPCGPEPAHPTAAQHSRFPARGPLAAACAEPGPAGRNLHTLRFRHGRLRRGVEGRASSRPPESAATTKRGPPPPHGSPRRGGARFVASGCHAHAVVGMSMSFPSAAGTCSRKRPREPAYRRQAWHRTLDVPRAGGSWRRVQNPALRAGTCTPYGCARLRVSASPCLPVFRSSGLPVSGHPVSGLRSAAVSRPPVTDSPGQCLAALAPAHNDAKSYHYSYSPGGRPKSAPHAHLRCAPLRADAARSARGLRCVRINAAWVFR